MSTPQTKEFSTLRSIFFPIHRHELKKFIPMALMMLFILFNYTVLRNIKDSLVVNAKGSGEEIITFLKTTGVVPCAIAFVLIYTKLANMFDRAKIFYGTVGLFIAFFGAFAFFIYPNIDFLHPDPATIESLQTEIPFLKWPLAMWGNWSFCVFYILAELWGSAVVSLFFWQFANEISLTHEAKRFYPLFGFFGNIGLVVSGFVVSALCAKSKVIVPGFDPWQVSLNWLMSIIVISGLIIIGLYAFVNNKVVPETTRESGVEEKPKSKKPKLGFFESFLYIFKSPHILCIAVLVIAYGMSINFIDVLWKGQVKLLVNKDNSAFTAYMGEFSTITGLIALPLMLAGGNILRKFSWTKAACIAPAVLMVTCVLFFGVIMYGMGMDKAAPILTIFGTSFTAVQLAAGIGKWQGALTKASKYSLFDATKEMAYIPLDSELRSKGKAAVDVTGGRLGKSAGSFTIMFLTMALPHLTLPQLAPYLAAISLGIFVVWFLAIGKLGRSLKELSEDSPSTADCGKAQLEAAPAK